VIAAILAVSYLLAAPLTSSWANLRSVRPPAADLIGLAIAAAMLPTIPSSARWRAVRRQRRHHIDCRCALDADRPNESVTVRRGTAEVRPSSRDQNAAWAAGVQPDGGSRPPWRMQPASRCLSRSRCLCRGQRRRGAVHTGVGRSQVSARRHPGSGAALAAHTGSKPPHGGVPAAAADTAPPARRSPTGSDQA